ncbi:MAG: hypothetical protein AAFO02_11410 [Bacteroidota bacterium]
MAILAVLACCTWSCGDSASEAATTAPTENTINQPAGNPNAKLVGEKWLRGQLSAQLGSQKLNLSGASQTELNGIEVTKSQATYGEDETTIVSITDLGKFGSNLGGVTPWLGKSINSTTGSSFQRSSYVENYPSLETYNAEKQLATISALVGNRFLVTATSTSMRTTQLRDAVATMELEDLAKGE